MQPAPDEARQLIRTLSRGIGAVLANKGFPEVRADLREGLGGLREELERLRSYLDTLDPAALPAECGIEELRRLHEELAPLFGIGASEFYAKVAEWGAGLNLPRTPSPETGVARHIWEVMAAAPHPELVHQQLLGFADGIRFAVAQEKHRSGIPRRMAGEDTRARVLAAWSEVEAACRARREGRTPPRREIIDRIARERALPRRTIERYAPKTPR